MILQLISDQFSISILLKKNKCFLTSSGETEIKPQGHFIFQMEFDVHVDLPSSKKYFEQRKILLKLDFLKRVCVPKFEIFLIFPTLLRLSQEAIREATCTPGFL